jgi:mRNA interferase MazF
VRRGELYRVTRGVKRDPKRSRVFAIVSRQVLLESRFSTVICAPVFSVHDGLATQVSVGPEQGLKHPSSLHCDELVSLLKSALTDYVGSLSESKLRELDRALKVALDLSA